MIEIMKGIVKVTQIGNSMGVIIPSSICKSWGIEKGSDLIMELSDQQITIRKEEK